MPREKLLNIQALRALAAMLVVFCHAGDIVPGGRQWSIGTGENGVDLFFVISGFIMVFTTINSAATPLSFIYNRILRVVPLYWLITFAVFALVTFVPSVFKGTRSDAGELLMSLFFIPYTKSNGSIQPMVFVGWTLNYEMFFYALFSLGLFARQKWLGVLGVIGILAALVAIGVFQSFTNVIAGFYTSPIISEFAYGMVLGMLWRKVPRSPLIGRFACFALVAAVGLFFCAPASTLRQSVVGYGGLAAVIVGAALVLESHGARVSSPLLQRLGDASYAIYMTHFFVTGAATKIARYLPQDVLTMTVLTIMIMVACALLGIAVHLWIERPMTAILKRLGRDATGNANNTARESQVR